MSVNTPAKLTLNTAEAKTVTLQRRGYQDYRVTLESRYNPFAIVGHTLVGFALGCGVFALAGASSKDGDAATGCLIGGAVIGLVGLLIDAPLGAATKRDYVLNPGEIDAKLVPLRQPVLPSPIPATLAPIPVNLPAQPPASSPPGESRPTQTAQSEPAPSPSAVGLPVQVPPPDPRAVEMEEKAKAAFNRGNYPEAVVWLDQAYQLTGAPNLLFNMALCRRKAGDTQGALVRFREYVQRFPGGPQRGAADRHISELERGLR
jgi:hypothetical protein